MRRGIDITVQHLCYGSFGVQQALTSWSPLCKMIRGRRGFQKGSDSQKTRLPPELGTLILAITCYVMPKLWFGLVWFGFIETESHCMYSLGCLEPSYVDQAGSKLIEISLPPR